MHRRTVLAAVGTVALAGCVDGDESADDGATDDAPSCDVVLREPSARYVYPVPTPRQLQAEVTVAASDCSGEGTASLYVEDERVASEPVGLDPDAPATVTLRNATRDLPRDAEAIVRVATTDGSVVAEQRVPIDDYRDEPADFDVTCHEVDPRAVEPGEDVTATLTVYNSGSATGFEARLLADDAVVATERGDVANPRTDGFSECHGSEVPLSASLPDAGEYELAAVVEPSAGAGSGDEADLGTVTVRTADE